MNISNSVRKGRLAAKDASYRLLTAVLGDDEHMVTLPVISGPAKGLRLRTDLVRRKDAYFWGKYDRHILNQLKSVVQPGWCVWDCGTYLGFYTCFFARAVGPAGQVVAIEPDPRNLARTMENVLLNRLTNVQAVNLAIGAPVGEVDFLLSDDTNSHLPNCYPGELAAAARWREKDSSLTRAKVKCVSLDQASFDQSLPRPHLIKLDIEGAELVALTHLTRITSEVRPIIVLELHNPECDAAAWEFAQRTGYTLYSLDAHRAITSLDEVRGTLVCNPRA
jgi:FkbM family methyltransferase